MTGTKYGCGVAQCGACTVLIDGQATRSCVTPVDSVAGMAIMTIEAIEQDAEGSKVVEAWVAHQVPQCGYCQSGQIMAATALLKQTPQPSDDDIAGAMVISAAAAPTTRSRLPSGTPRRLEEETMNDMTPSRPPVQARRRRHRSMSRVAVSSAVASGTGAFGDGAGRTRPGAGGRPVTPGTRVNAFLEIRPDSTVLFRSAFIEGGQGVFTAMAQIVGEELDVDPAKFVVEGAPPGPDYLLTGGGRFTGGSMSVRMSYETMRKLGASARQMLLQAAANGSACRCRSCRPNRAA